MREDMYKTMAPAGKQAFPALFVKQERKREKEEGWGGYGQSFPPLSECFSPFQLFRDDDDGRQHFIFGSPFFFCLQFPVQKEDVSPPLLWSDSCPFCRVHLIGSDKNEVFYFIGLINFPLFCLPIETTY